MATLDPENTLICFTNARLATPEGALVTGDLWIDSHTGRILDAQRTFFAGRRPERIIDLGGNVLCPGFVDVQINGAYGVDFSLYDDDERYLKGLERVATRIVETGVTALVPTIVTQSAELYPTLLRLLRPHTYPTGAHLLGWHAEGPFLQPSKRGAHTPALLRAAPDGWDSIEAVYGAANLAEQEDWLMQNADGGAGVGVRVVTGAPELEGVGASVGELARRGVVFSLGHSIAPTVTASRAIAAGARLITHLFNAMPQLHHRDPCIIGLLGSSPSLAGTFAASSSSANPALGLGSEALDAEPTPAPTPAHTAPPSPPSGARGREKVVGVERPWYGLIVDGVHSHPNSVRVRPFSSHHPNGEKEILTQTQLAYGAHPAGCILVTDAMSVLDPHLPDGVHAWRDGVNFVKAGARLYLEGTDTLAGSVVTMDTCVRNFVKFTGCTLGEAVRCATFNPAQCLGIADRKGTLRPGADADLVVLDDAGRVLSTWVAGREVWTRPTV
ncbi:hypothetical protein HWV62_6869 [Athelia sp. TMB]|nr:hypothetical protein HWV62_6869 [Athelia sp. TMB]